MSRILLTAAVVLFSLPLVPLAASAAVNENAPVCVQSCTEVTVCSGDICVSTKSCKVVAGC